MHNINENSGDQCQYAISCANSKYKMAPNIANLYKTQVISHIGENATHSNFATANQIYHNKTHTKLPACLHTNYINTPHANCPLPFTKRRSSATEKLPKIISIIQTPNNNLQCTTLKSLAICNSNSLMPSPLNLKLKKITYQVMHTKRNCKPLELPIKLKSIVFGRNFKVFPKHFSTTQSNRKRISIDIPSNQNYNHSNEQQNLNKCGIKANKYSIEKESSTRTIDYELSPWKFDYNC